MKTKALISWAVTAVTGKLVSVLVFTYADCWFSHDVWLKQMLIQQYIYIYIYTWKKVGVHLANITILSLRNYMYMYHFKF